jgi:glycosyltransferase involved in cell wall biosynthesis
VISRYTEWKGIQYIIPAFAEIKKSFPNATLILANAQGDYEASILSLLTKIPVQAYREIKFEEDLAALYNLFDVFIHVPVDEHVEAFGQTYVEPLVAGIPSIFTRSGIAREFITHRQNAWLVDFRNSPQIVEGAITILNDTELRTILIANGRESVKKFSLQDYLLKLENLYL